MKKLLFSTNSELVRVPIDALVSVTADGNYSSIMTSDGSRYILTQQLGQIERLISEYLDKEDNRFIRLGRSLIINRDYITNVNLSRQRLIMSDCRSFRHEFSASRDALKALKDLIEKEG